MSILQYWRNSLADADRLNPDFEKKKRQGLIISYEELRNGVISIDTVNQLIANLADTKKTLFEVLICPVVMYKKQIHGSSVTSKLQTSMVPLWIPAEVNMEGVLKPHKRFIPWICREYLDPCESDIDPIGSISEVDQFLSSNPLVFEQWRDCFAFANDMFFYVTGMSLQNYSHKQYQLSNQSFLLSNDLIVGTSRAIQDLYENILRDHPESTKLLNTFKQLSNEPSQPVLSSLDCEQLSSLHLGQMSNQFSLSESQRTAMHHTNLLEHGDLLAINGPPGTGKTTLLQSIVATAIIERALQKAEPPVIVVSSTNNNAVTNVIESFGKINEVTEDNSLAGRWIPSIRSYGAYLKSSFSNDGVKASWLTVMKNSNGGYGFFDKMENFDYLAKCSVEYLENCSRFAGYEIVDVRQATDFLHLQLENKINNLRKIIFPCSKK